MCDFYDMYESDYNNSSEDDTYKSNGNEYDQLHKRIRETSMAREHLKNCLAIARENLKIERSHSLSLSHLYHPSFVVTLYLLFIIFVSNIYYKKTKIINNNNNT